MTDRDFKGVWIPKEIWLDKRLNMLEKGILTEIDSLDNENGCSAGNEYLAEFCQCSETKVSTAIKKLIDLDYIYLQSFNGRTRILKSRVSKFKKQSLNNLKAEFKNFKENNINNNTFNNTNNKKVSKKESTKSFDDIIAENFENEKVKLELIEFIKMRKQIKKPMTNRALELLISKLKQMSNNDCDLMVKLLDQSIEHSWQTIYELKDNKGWQKPVEQPKDNFTKHQFSSEELNGLFDNLDDIKVV